MALGLSLLSKEVSVLLPAHNEALCIKNCINEVEKTLISFTNSYEIIVTEDGSTDDTESIVKGLMKSNPNVVFLHSPVRLGKGRAIKRALRVAKGEVVVFMDVDLATSLSCLPRIVQLTKEKSGLVIGSRYAKGAKVKRPISRTVFSLGYNLFVRALFFDGVRDHQCGFKAMSHKFLEAINYSVNSDGWVFDTELIVRCKKLGFPLLEMEVEWTETRRKKDSKVNLFQDASKMGKDLLRFRFSTL